MQEFLASCGGDLAALLNSLVGNVSPRGLLLLLPPFGLTLLVSQGGPPLELLTPALHSTITTVSKTMALMNMSIRQERARDLDESAVAAATP